MKRDTSWSLALAGTFVIEPLSEPLEFWWERLGLGGAVELAPFNQVFQQLFDPAGVLSRSRFQVLLIRWEDLAGTPCVPAAAERSASELIGALASVSRPTLIVLCHPSPAARASLGDEALARADAALAAAFAGSDSVQVVGAVEFGSLYPVRAPFDPYGARVGTVPFALEYYTALATLIARHTARWLRAPYKVIVLDCDETLWIGRCAEIGPAAVVPRTSLQAFLAEQAAAGMLLCMCSKNEPADVHAVFTAQPGMPLAARSFVAERINWRPKSENLRALADELDIGLDRFVVLDDDPVECAELVAGCPEALTLQLPSDPALIAGFLRHVWAFDHGVVTSEDRGRTASYHQRRERDALQGSAPSLASFLASLQLEVDVQPLGPEHVARVAQLTERTTQFNVSGRRRLESELAGLLSSGQLSGVVAFVRDRFGDYGLVGAALYRQDAVLDVDTFLLSCRALGRGVEHRMLAHLGRLAKGAVRILHRPTGRNTPARQFLSETLGAWRQWGDPPWLFEAPASVAAEVAHEPSRAPAVAPEAPLERPVSPGGAATSALARIAQEAGSVETLHQALRSFRFRPRAASGWRAPESPTEAAMADIWAAAFGLDRVSRDDEFLVLGGHSLLAAQIMSAVWAAFRVELPLGTILHAPTPASMAAEVDRRRATADVDTGLPAVDAAPADRHAPFPLTELQEAYWVGRGDSFALGNVGAHNYVELDFHGLDLDRYTAAWQGVIDRHDMLRAIVLPDGRLEILRQVPKFRIDVQDLRGLAPGAVEEALRSRRAELSTQVLASDRWPLFDVRATRTDAGTVRLHLSFDGLLCDLWSQHLILCEVARRYDDPALALPPLPFTFRDYVLGWRSCESSPRWQRARRYWRGRLESLPAAPDLPLARSPESIEKPRFVRRTARLSAASWERLKEQAAARSLTPSGLLLAAFCEVLAVWSKSRRFTVNVTHFNRQPFHADVDALVGDFTSLSLLEVWDPLESTCRHASLSIL